MQSPPEYSVSLT